MTPVELWLQLLESGELSQTIGELRTSQGYCCLGVACEAYNRATGKGQWGQNEISSKYYFLVDADQYEERQTAFLPKGVRDWLGLQFVGGNYSDDQDTLQALTILNDQGVPFADIAAIIRSRPEGLFRDDASD